MTLSFVPTQPSARFVDDECLHGMTPAWCGVCKGMDTRSVYAPTIERTLTDGPSKQDSLDKVCRILGAPRTRIGEGSSLPAAVFRAAARFADVPSGSMPVVAEAIVTKAGLVWGEDCDSRDTNSAGGSTVTRAGLALMASALEVLAASKACADCATVTLPGELVGTLCGACADARLAVAV